MLARRHAIAELVEPDGGFDPAKRIGGGRRIVSPRQRAPGQDRPFVAIHHDSASYQEQPGNRICGGTAAGLPGRVGATHRFGRHVLGIFVVSDEHPGVPAQPRPRGDVDLLKGGVGVQRPCWTGFGHPQDPTPCQCVFHTEDNDATPRSVSEEPMASPGRQCRERPAGGGDRVDAAGKAVLRSAWSPPDGSDSPPCR
jgi:hypothetical protein